MSKYAELRELLKEDITEIVEITFKNRLENIVQSLMPSILDTVADSIKLHDYTSGGPEKSLHLTMEHTDPVNYAHTSRTIGNPIQLVNPYYVTILNNRITQLEGEVRHLTHQLNDCTP